jgi:hypothetical protein
MFALKILVINYRLEHMTVYRVRLYGEVILTVTSEYHQQRMEHLASQTEAARSAQQPQIIPSSAAAEP